eukprot:UN0905
MQLARDRQKIVLCSTAGVRLVVVPYTVRDRWNFVRLCLLEWFSPAEIFPVMIA